MKLRLKFLSAALLAAFGVLSARAQTQPVLSVDINEIDVLSGSGRVVFIGLTNYGSGYVSAPTVNIIPAVGDPGSGATAVATVNLSGQVSSIVITNQGSGYLTPPTITFSSPTGTNPVQAEAQAYLGSQQFFTPFQNESYGTYKTTIAVTALATGTFPAAGFTYTYYANGISLGSLTPNPPNGTPGILAWTPPQPGTYYLTVSATDGANKATSLPVRYFSTGVEITSPTPNTIVPTGSSIVLQANATPRPLTGGTAYTSSPTVTLSGGGGAGATATAQIGQGLVSGATITSGGAGYTSAPTVKITAAPGDNGTGATATATITAGQVSVITITNGGNGYATPPTISFSGGGGAGAAATATINATVTGFTITSGGTGYTSAPTVAIAGGGGSGASGIATITNGVVTGIQLNSANAFVSKIDFYVDGTKVGSDSTFPYSVIYTPAGGVPSHTVQAKAYDNNGNLIPAEGNGDTITIFMVPPIGTPPTVSINSPADNAVVAIPSSGSGPIPVNVSAQSATGLITKVELYADGSLLGTSTTFPYSFTWTPTVVGTYGLIALAYDDKSNVVASVPTPIHVKVAASPTVTLVSPVTGATVAVNSPTSLTAAASDSNLGGSISKVQFFANGVFVGETTTPTSGNNYSINWTPSTAGPVAITAVAINNLGLSTTSTAANITASAGGGGGPGGPIGSPPSVTVTYPTASSQLPVNKQTLVTASATDIDGNIVSVQFFANGQSIGTSSAYPYSATWTPTSLGTYNLTAKATDNDGNTTTSGSVQVTVVDPTPGYPAVSVTSPANNATVNVGVVQTLLASATDAGSIAGVQFFVNGQPQGSLITTFPFTTSWTPASPGTYIVTARAINGSGNQTTSSPITVNVTAGTPPTTTITAPITGATLAVNTPQTITATATSTTSTIANVQFFVNGTLIGTKTSYPYSVSWTPASPGSYTLIARATDALGNFSNSASTTVTVATGTPPTVTVTNPTNNSTYTVATPLSLTATAASTTGTVTQVQFLVNNVPLGTAATTAPYTTTWTPNAAGTYTITAQATDNSGNVTTSSPISVAIRQTGAPSVAITTPTSGATAASGTVVSLVATAAAADGTIANVKFFANGNPVGAATVTAPYATEWTPTAVGAYTLVAQATDSAGNVTNSAPVTLNVIANQPPTVTLNSPTAGYSTSAGLPVLLAASASDNDDAVARVRFLVNGSVVGTSTTSSPYTFTWTPTAGGTYTIVAEAMDSVGNVADSAPVTITVGSNKAPTVSITTPANGGTVSVASAVTLQATAKDSDGTIASVQFYVNGTAFGAPITTYPYRTSWTPNSEGIYRIIAVATDDGGASTSSSTVTVMAVSATSALLDKVYTGPFNGVGDNGRFAIISSGDTATFIGYSTASPAKIYYFPDLTVDAAGGFSGTDAAGHTISGSASDTGVTVTLNGTTLLIGIAANGLGTPPVPAGHYLGSLSGMPGSAIDAIVGNDGSIMVYVVNGTYADAAAGTLTAAGTATLTSGITGNKITVTINPTSGFLTGSITGSTSATLSAALGSGIAFSDGTLRNLSTRGNVGTGDNILIAGFVVAGDTAKNVLIRAVGPSLSVFGLSGYLSDPQMQLLHGSTQIANNDDWGNSSDIATASAQVGAFPLLANSKDSALLVKLDPGQYTALVSGFGGATGIALVELYDVDSTSPFTPQKVMNVSTRGNVGAGASQLIAGFVVSGNIAKKVLIRGVGPGLATVGVTHGTLSDPMLRLSHSVNGVDTLVRENDNWEQGNDPAAVVEASTAVGAFPLNSGSKDAAILITLPPGIYTAQVSGANGATGIALVEVYEVSQ